MQRRRVLRSIGCIAGTGIATSLAGCTGNESLEETQAAVDQAFMNLEAAGQGFNSLQQNLENEEWESCLSNTEPVREDLSAAETNATEAQELASENGHTDHEEVASLILEQIGILNDMTDEIEGICQAASNENFEEVNQRLDTLEDLDQQRQDTQQDLDEAAQALEG